MFNERTRNQDISIIYTGGPENEKKVEKRIKSLNLYKLSSMDYNSSKWGSFFA